MDHQKSKRRSIFHKRTSTKKDVKKSNKYLKQLHIILTSPKFTAILLLITIIIYYITISEDDVNIQGIQRELESLVHGQIDAINSVNNTLLDFYSNNKQNFHILGFFGPSGVGKTFIGNIIKKHFHSTVHELQAPLANVDRNAVLSKINNSWTHYNLVLIDDLKILDLNSLLTLIKEISEDLHVLFICIFNIQETDNNLVSTVHYEYVKQVQETFAEADMEMKVAVFHEFSTNQVESWVTKQLTNNGVKSEFVAEITNSVLEEQDIKSYGLKGINAKINLRL